jgi:hypothetical protein
MHADGSGTSEDIIMMTLRYLNKILGTSEDQRFIALYGRSFE